MNAAGGNARAPFAQRRERYRGVCEIVGVSIVRYEFMCGSALPRKSDHNDIVRITPGQPFESSPNGGNGRYRIRQQFPRAAESIHEESVQSGCIAAAAAQLVDFLGCVLVNANE